MIWSLSSSLWFARSSPEKHTSNFLLKIKKKVLGYFFFNKQITFLYLELVLRYNLHTMKCTDLKDKETELLNRQTDNSTIWPQPRGPYPSLLGQAGHKWHSRSIGPSAGAAFWGQSPFLSRIYRVTHQSSVMTSENSIPDSNAEHGTVHHNEHLHEVSSKLHLF